MSVKQTRYGTWQTRWRDIDGRQRARTFRTRALAEKHERKVRTDTDRGLPTAPGRRLSTAAWATAWLQGAHNLEPSSQRIYREAWAHLEPELGRLPLHKLNAGHIDQALAGYAATGAAPSSVSRAFRTLRTMLNAAVDRDLIVKSPMRGVKAPRVPRQEMRFLSAVELERLASAIDPRYRSLVLVAGWGGLRWGELAGLRMGDVDHDARRVHVTGQLSTDGRRWKPETKTSGTPHRGSAGVSDGRAAAGRRWLRVDLTAGWPARALQVSATLLAPSRHRRRARPATDARPTPHRGRVGGRRRRPPRRDPSPTGAHVDQDDIGRVRAPLPGAQRQVAERLEQVRSESRRLRAV